MKCKICDNTAVDYEDMSITGIGDYWGWCLAHEGAVSDLLKAEQMRRKQEKDALYAEKAAALEKLSPRERQLLGI